MFIEQILKLKSRESEKVCLLLLITLRQGASPLCTGPANSCGLETSLKKFGIAQSFAEI